MEKYIVDAFIYFYTYFRLDMTKRAGWVGSGQSSWRVKRVMGQNGSFLNGSIGSGLPVFFKQIYIYIYIYFFQLQKQINDNLFRENE